MLERAAAAAGYVIVRWAQHNYPIVRDGDREFGWNPRVFDSDALRLAVKLRLSHLWQHDWLMVYRGDDSVRERDLSDPYAATRLAITRAAAALAPTAQGE